MIKTIFIIYLIFINLISSIIFILDKYKAKKGYKRISEKTLHIFEFFGGIFTIIFLMNIVKHKRKKFEYFLISYLILIIWVLIIVNLFFYFI